MNKRQVTKLVAVVAIASASPAMADNAGNPSVAHRAPASVPAARVAQLPAARPLLSVVRAVLATAEALQAVATPAPQAVEAKPRRLPSGAPACGNVASRAPRKCE